MKKFLFEIFIFIVILLLFNFLIFFSTKPLYNESVYLNMVKKADENSSVFILSDSHGLSLIDEDLNKSGISNLSFGSDSYSDMLEKTRYLINNFNVKKIVITVDAHTLSKYRENSNNNDQSTLLNDPVRGLASFLYRYLPLCNYRYRDLFKGYLLSKFKPNKQDQSPLEAERAEDEDTAADYELAWKRYQYQFPTKTSSISLQSDFQKIIDLCIENNVILIGIRYPLSKLYQGIVGDFDYGAKELAKSRGLKILDYEKIYSEYGEYFADPDHLNYTGGKILTEKLLQDLSYIF